MYKLVNVLVHNLLSRFNNIISVCLIGSRRNNYLVEECSDLDVLVIVDDSEQIDKNYVKNSIKKIGTIVSDLIHVQVFFLSEFWKYIETGSPITYTMIRDGIAYYDIGFFEVMQKLVKKGLVKPKTEAVERQLSIAKQLMSITYHSFNKGFVQNLEGAIVSAVQSLLIEMGIEPPSPKQVPEFLKKYLVDRGILSEGYYFIASNVIQTYKDIEHKKRAPLSGDELQKMYNDTNEFIMKIEDIIQDFRKRLI